MAANGIQTHFRTNQRLWIEVAVIFKLKTTLSTQPSQLCVDSSMLAYNRHTRHFRPISLLAW